MGLIVDTETGTGREMIGQCMTGLGKLPVTFTPGVSRRTPRPT
jgi:hypothetical protein